MSGNFCKSVSNKKFAAYYILRFTKQLVKLLATLCKYIYIYLYVYIHSRIDNGLSNIRGTSSLATAYFNM
jgi:hypothetical protein